jgi:hypothetical protein
MSWEKEWGKNLPNYKDTSLRAWKTDFAKNPRDSRQQICVSSVLKILIRRPIISTIEAKSKSIK